MTGPAPASRPNPLFLRDEEIRQGMELLFFAQRDFSALVDDVLRPKGLGRAHMRALYFIGRRPGLTIGDLLATLRITKQSLNRVLSGLMAAELVAQTQGLHDRRQRHLKLTPAGSELERELGAMQRARLARAYREAGAEAVAGFRKVLVGLIDERRRPAILKAIEKD